MKEFMQENIDILNSINDRAKELFNRHDPSGAMECFNQIDQKHFPEEFKTNLVLMLLL
jgi:hypothetical protein